MNAFRKVKIPGVDFDLEPVPIPIQVVEVNEIEEHDDEHDDGPPPPPDNHHDDHDEHPNEHPTDHRNDHPNDHRSDPRTEHRTNHPIEHQSDHRTDHPIDHQRDHRTEHRTDQPIDHQSDHRTDHPIDHHSDHPTEHRTDRPIDHQSDHRNDHPNDHRSDHQTDHGSDHHSRDDVLDAHHLQPEPPQREQIDDDNLITEPPVNQIDHHSEAPTESPDVHFFPETTPKYLIPKYKRPIRKEPKFRKNKFDRHEENDDKVFDDRVMNPMPSISPNSDSYHGDDHNSDSHPHDPHHDDKHSGTLPHSHLNDFIGSNSPKHMPSIPYNGDDGHNHDDGHDHQIERIEQHDPGSGQNKDEKMDKIDESPPVTNPHTYIRQLMPTVFDQSPIPTPETHPDPDFDHHHHDDLHEENEKLPEPERQIHNENVPHSPETSPNPNEPPNEEREEKHKKPEDQNKDDVHPMNFHLQTEREVGARGDQILKYYEDQSKVDSKRLTRLAESDPTRHGIHGSPIINKDNRDNLSKFKNYKNTNEPQVINENKQIDKRVGFSPNSRSEPTTYRSDHGEPTPTAYYDKPRAGARVYAKKQEYHSYDENNPDKDEEDESDGKNDELNASYDKWSDEHLKLVEEELKKPVRPYHGNKRTEGNVKHQPKVNYPANDKHSHHNKQLKLFVPNSEDYEKARIREPSEMALRNENNKPKSQQRHQPQYQKPQQYDNKDPHEYGRHDKTELDKRYNDKNHHEDHQKYKDNQQYYKEKDFNDKDHEHHHDEDPDDGHYHDYYNERTPDKEEQQDQHNHQTYRKDNNNDNNNNNNDNIPKNEKISSNSDYYKENGDQSEERPDDEFQYELPEKQSNDDNQRIRSFGTFNQLPFNLESLIASDPPSFLDGLAPRNLTEDSEDTPGDSHGDTYRQFETDSDREMSGRRNPDQFASDERSHQSSTPSSDTEYHKEYEPQRNPPHIDASHPSHPSRHRHYLQNIEQSKQSQHSRRSHNPNSHSSQPQRDITETKAYNDQRNNYYDQHMENKESLRQKSASRPRTPDVKAVNNERTSQKNYQHNDRDDDYMADNGNQQLERPQVKYDDRNGRRYSRGWPQYYDEEKAATVDSSTQRADPKTGKMLSSESMNVETQTNSSIDQNNDNNTIAIKDIDSVDAWAKSLSLSTKLTVVDNTTDTTIGLESHNANDAKEKIFQLRLNDKKRTRNITRKPRLQKLINLHNTANKSLIYDMLINPSNSTQFDLQQWQQQQNHQNHQLDHLHNVHSVASVESNGTASADVAQSPQLTRTVRTRPQRSIAHEIINSVRNSNNSDNYKSTKNLTNILTNISDDNLYSTTTNKMSESEEPKCSKVSPIDGFCFGSDYEYPL